MEFATPIVNSVVQILMVPVKKHLGFLVSSTKYVKQMDAKMKELKDTAEEVEATWGRALGNTEVVPGGVETWLEDVKNLNERSQYLKEPVKCFNVKKRYKVGKKSYDLVEEIKELMKTRESKMVFTHAQIPLAELGSASALPSSSSPGDQIDFESRKLVFSNALQALQSNDESRKMIALCGMGGVGKTTMMQQLKKVVEGSDTFDSVVKVVIGENINSINLQQAIAQYLAGNDLSESAKDARADRLRKIFEAKSQQGKKILVIMDDLWKEFDLTDVGLSPLPNGFKLLFTSRFEDECTKMGVRIDSIFKVGVLNYTEAKNLFSRTVGPSPSYADDVELQRIGDEIVKKCGGLPIAIVTIAKSLIGNIKEAWEEALSNLHHNDLQEFDDILHKVFEMSYNNLKKEDDKAIFLLSGLFPDDFDIPIEDLMRYAWGLKLFTKVDTLAQARRHSNICVKNLISANLLTESDRNGFVKMHDLVRAFVLSNYSKVKQASVIYHNGMPVKRLSKDVSEPYERILLKCTDTFEFPSDFDCSNLSLIILMNENNFFENEKKFLEFPNDTYERMKKIEVISYEKISIPFPIEHFTKLRALCLRSCLLLNDISFLGSLFNLETLSLVDCDIRRLPSPIGKLKKLKLLDLTGCIDLLIDDGVIQNLDSIEELYMRSYQGLITDSKNVRFTHANCYEMEKLSHRLLALELEFLENKPNVKNMSFKNLKRFNISIGCGLERVYHDPKNYSFKNKLNLVATCTELRECNISDLFEETEELKLQVNDMYNLEDLSMHHTFAKLKVLHVSKCADLTYLFTVAVASGLKKLEQLIISECPNLKEMVGGNNGVGVITFQNLNFLSLKGLPKMISLYDNLIELPKLVKLKIYGLPHFTTIYSDNNNNNNNVTTMQPLLNKEVTIPKLEKLDISMMENLKQIWPCEISTSEKNGVSTLRQIRVSNCDSLINLFPSNPLPLLNHLEELEVKKCNSIEVLFNIDFECVSGMGEYISRLRSIRAIRLGELKELWRMRGANNSNIAINGFKGVENIKIKYCHKFTNVFSPTTTNFNLGALTTYKTKYERPDVEAQRDGEINMTYPSHLWLMCHQLQRLKLEYDNRVKEVVFEMNSLSSRHLPTIQDGQPGPLLPHLEVLNLLGLKEMSHVWLCSWNKFLIPQNRPLQLPFHNLTNILLCDCPKLKYLFSPLMAKYLSNLREVHIVKCDGIEEVMSSRDDENEENTTSASSHQNTIFFPHLDTLWLTKLSCLKSIDGGDQTRSRSGKNSSNLTNTLHGQSQSAQVSDACWSLCQYPREISIVNCDALSSLVPWYSVRQMKSLQVLEIRKCKTMKEVFESESSTSYNVDEGSTPGTTLVVPQLTNLKSVDIYGCDTLSHVFTFSTLESLSQLKELRVEFCEAMQVIVKEENETSSKDIVVFPRLETLELEGLPNLKGFFLGLNDFRWPILNDVMINNCPRLMVFTSGQSNTPKLKYIRTKFGKYSVDGLNFDGTVNVNQTTFLVSSSSDLTVSKGMLWSSFHNLIEIQIRYGKFSNYIIPSNVLLPLEKLEKIEIDEYDGEEEVVFEALEGSGFNESQPTTVVKIPNLTEVKLFRFRNLKYLWKSNRSMVLEFPNLTTLSITYCHSLEHVFTCSMVGSLVQLQDLKIGRCDNMEVIVKEEEYDVKVNALPRLKSLKLEYLPKLKGFCLGKDAFSLPTLYTLEIQGCKAIEVFTQGDLSAPNLEIINSNWGMFTIYEDFNSLIETNQEKVPTRPRHLIFNVLKTGPDWTARFDRSDRFAVGSPVFLTPVF